MPKVASLNCLVYCFSFLCNIRQVPSWFLICLLLYIADWFQRLLYLASILLFVICFCCIFCALLMQLLLIEWCKDVSRFCDAKASNFGFCDAKASKSFVLKLANLVSNDGMLSKLVFFKWS